MRQERPLRSLKSSSGGLYRLRGGQKERPQSALHLDSIGNYKTGFGGYETAGAGLLCVSAG